MAAREAAACFILQIKKPRALTGLNFCSRFAFRMIGAPNASVGRFRLLSFYERFEHVVIMFLTALIAVIVIAAI